MVTTTISSPGTVMNDVQLTDVQPEFEDGEWTPPRHRRAQQSQTLPHEWTRRNRRNGMTIGAQLSLRSKQNVNKVEVKYDFTHDEGALDWTNINVILEVCFTNYILA